jgi:hypothetical protein
MGKLARSLLAHGKAREAEVWARKAEAAGGGPDAAHARLLLDLVDTRDGRDPEIPLSTADDLAPPVLPPDVTAALGDRIAREYTEIDALMRARKYVTAYKVIEAWPERIWGRLGQDFSLVAGFLDYKAEFYGDAIDELKALAEDRAYVTRRPALLYYLGRAYHANANYTKAVAALERYIEAQRSAGQPLLPASAAPAATMPAVPAAAPAPSPRPRGAPRPLKHRRP